jgi:hypothetical protein
MLSLRDNTFVFVFSSLMAYTQAQNTRWYSEQYFDPVQHAKAEHQNMLDDEGRFQCNAVRGNVVW